MATFNPQVPDTQDPNYLHYSKPIETPNFKSTVGMALKTAGDVLESGVKGVDEVIKAFSKQDVQKEVEPIRDEYKQSLMNVRNAYETAEQTGALNIIPKNVTQNYPVDLQNLPKDLQALTGARKSGKISETDYIARVDSKLSDIKSRYPVGYNDYIESQVENVTGFKPANKLIQSLIGDINAHVAGSGDLRKKSLDTLETLVREGVYEGSTYGEGQTAAKLRQYVMNTPNADLSFVDNEINRMQSKLYKNKVDEGALKIARETRQNTKEDEQDRATNVINGSVSEAFVGWENLAKTLGMQKDEGGNYKETQPGQWDLVNKQFQAQRDVAMRGLRTALLEQQAKSGGKLTNEWIEGQLKATDFIWQRSTDRLTDDKNGAMFEAHRLFESIRSNDQLNAFKNESMGEIFRKIDLLSTIGKTDAVKEFLISNLGDGMSKKVADFLKINKLNVVTAKGGQGIVPLQEVFDEARKQGGQFPRGFDAFTENMYKLTVDSRIGDDAKTNIVASIVDPRNANLLAQIAPGERQVINGVSRWVPGKEAMFTRLTRDDFVQEVYRLGKQHPELIREYEDRINTWAQKDLFSKDISLLNDLPTEGNEGWNLNYNNQDHKFFFKFKGGLSEEQRIRHSSQTLQIEEPVINRLNSLINDLKNVAKAKNVNVDAYVLNFFSQAGYSPDRLKSLSGVPEEMLRSLISTSDQAAEHKKTLEAERKKFKKEAE